MDIIKILREKDSEELNKIHNQKDLKDRLKAYPLFFCITYKLYMADFRLL